MEEETALMGSIRVLPEFLANKIAAGEVIERPASIVKELVENSLDAGASSIEIEIHHGGKSFVRVSDDGCGMDREDARLAFQRHATSKIRSTADLEGIASFGFRGEALPSIGAVSRCRLITRAGNDPVGTEVVVEGGSLKGVQDHPCRKGTIAEVRDLFFNTPARRKFLKGDSTELGQVLDVVTRMALPALGARFVLRSEEKVMLDLPPAGRLLDRVRALWGEEAAEMLEMERQSDGLQVRGLIGKPSFTRGNRGQIHLFVNRRWVKSLPLSYALQAGYCEMLMEGRYPVAVLFLETDLKRVDVNVHPTKQEVRISGEPEVTALIQEAVRHTLEQAGTLAPRLAPAAEPRPDSRAESRGGPGRVVAPPLAPATQRSYVLQPGPTSFSQPWGSVMESARSPISVKGKLEITRLLGQLHNTFLVAETLDGFVIVDQHAAHERVVYEALLRNMKSGQLEKQMLLLEELLELQPRLREIFERSRNLLTRLGFEMEPFGENGWVIRAYPAALGQVNPVQLVRTFLEQVEDGKLRTALEESEEAVAALCACKKGSVKAGDPLEPQAMWRLLERLAACENPFTCPHGRPVFFTQSLSDLERQFKRT